VAVLYGQNDAGALSTSRSPSSRGPARMADFDVRSRSLIKQPTVARLVGGVQCLPYVYDLLSPLQASVMSSPIRNLDNCGAAMASSQQESPKR
jgi:hypothetical protein